MVGDASVDIVSSISGTYGGYELYTGNGDGTFGTAVLTDSIGGAISLVVTDLDNDTDMDLFLPIHGRDSIAVVINDGGTLLSAVKFDGGTSACSFNYANDFDGDDYNDIAIANYDENSVAVLMNTGSGGTTDVKNDAPGSLPDRFQLNQNHPNPFNPVTTIDYNLPRRSNVRIDIFNLLGQRIRTVVNREEPAGSYSVTWDGKDSAGKAVATGIYFYRLKAEDFVETKKMLLLK